MRVFRANLGKIGQNILCAPKDFLLMHLLVIRTTLSIKSMS